MTPELARYLEEALRRLQAALDLEALYLFGSHARGDGGPKVGPGPFGGGPHLPPAP
jgi:predicted nucleotidyltransferase